MLMDFIALCAWPARASYEMGGRVGVNGTLSIESVILTYLPILVTYENIPSPPLQGFTLTLSRENILDDLKLEGAVAARCGYLPPVLQAGSGYLPTVLIASK